MNELQKGGDIYLVGGGKSLRGFNFMRLKNRQVICCNRAFEFIPWAMAVCFYDPKFYEKYRKQLLAFDGWKITHKQVTGTDAQGNNKIVELRSDFAGEAVNNTGHFALNVALKFTNPDRIFLLGYDYTDISPEQAKQMKPGDLNFYTYPEGMTIAGFGQYVEKFDEFKGMEIYNCNPDSNLTQFKYVDIDTII